MNLDLSTTSLCPFFIWYINNVTKSTTNNQLNGTIPAFLTGDLHALTSLEIEFQQFHWNITEYFELVIFTDYTWFDI